MNRFLAYIDTKFKELKLKLKAFSLFLFIVNMYRYSIDYTQETLRTFSLYIIKILGLKFNFNIIFNRVLVFLNQRLLFFFVKYIMTFFFIIWLLFEMFFLRFYLVTTPTDSQISIDRKEIHEGYSRFLPVMFTETLMFFSRPNRRVFRILWLVFANLKAIVWLIEIVYFEDIRFILNKFFYFFFKFLHIIFFFLSFFFKFIFVGVVFLYDVIYFFFKLHVVKLLKLLFFFFYYLVFLPFFMLKQIMRFCFLVLPKFFLFLTIFSFSEFFYFFKHLRFIKESNKGVRKWQSNRLSNYIFDRVFFLYVLALYLNYKSAFLDKHPWYYLNIQMISFWSSLYHRFFFFFLFWWFLYFVLIVFFYVILFFFFFHPVYYCF